MALFRSRTLPDFDPWFLKHYFLTVDLPYSLFLEPFCHGYFKPYCRVKICRRSLKEVHNTNYECTLSITIIPEMLLNILTVR